LFRRSNRGTTGEEGASLGDGEEEEAGVEGMEEEQAQED